MVKRISGMLVLPDFLIGGQMRPRGVEPIVGCENRLATPPKLGADARLSGQHHAFSDAPGLVRIAPDDIAVAEMPR